MAEEIAALERTGTWDLVSPLLVFVPSREKYIQDLLARAALRDERTVDTPMELNVKLRPTDGDPLPDPTRPVFQEEIDTSEARGSIRIERASGNGGSDGPLLDEEERKDPPPLPA
ncbi:hypothetical protein QYE76_040599 [Lolium multiflorum]|uniref:Uncharacterized protein n=1 Tax=Lolium multiflorum TaxID=4521 RepID=A0AAD8TDN0_LOLMU|nr:hypothetical protein QYE76_040599 [Lolium multiflorum]